MYAELERKICTKCNVSKGQEEFSKRSARAIGIASWCKACLDEWRREDKKKNLAKYQEYEFKRGLRRFYGITVEQYNIMFQNQNGGCACCGGHQSLFKRRLHVDHDHETGKIRALLCTECNPGIGYFKHSKERLRMAIAYLEKFEN